ncbi:MAG: hypothetical protein ACRBCJ_07340 [Hyphomicrobiaceae bacterium]
MSRRTAQTVAKILRDAKASAREQANVELAALSDELMLSAAFLIEEIREQFELADVHPLSMLGVEIEDDDGLFVLMKGGQNFIVEPAEDGAVLVNGEPIYSTEPFFTDELYQAVFKRISDWATKIDDERPR